MVSVEEISAGSVTRIAELSIHPLASYTFRKYVDAGIPTLSTKGTPLLQM